MLPCSKGTDSKQFCFSKYPTVVITVNQWDALDGCNSTILILVPFLNAPGININCIHTV